ncbi:MAG: tyrosine-type recombinase/integrase [Candidatus Thermoplasmatota archaeon]|nr:tyrosine-type recombinase/integrase [Candidatus Thermoplasmatota archaeon]
MVSIETIRGLMADECLAICSAPRKLPVNASKFCLWKSLRDEILVRTLYETFARISELLYVKVADVDFKQRAIRITRPKGKAVFRIVDGRREHVDTLYVRRWVFFGDYTRDLIIRHLAGRKRGYLITTSRGKQLSTRQAERIVDHYARKAGVQEVVGHTKGGREVRLVTCKALREAGERHTDVAGADRDATARVAGHTVMTKERYYKKGNFEEDRKVVRDHHPLMRPSE